MASFVNLDTVQRPSANATGFSAWGDQVNDNCNVLYGDVAWTRVTYGNGWADNGGGFQVVGYRKVGTRVHLRGTMKSGTIAVPAFVLPVGYQPLAALLFPCASNAAYGELMISTNGSCTPAVGSSVSFSLDGINFDTI